MLLQPAHYINFSRISKQVARSCCPFYCTFSFTSGLKSVRLKARAPAETLYQTRVVHQKACVARAAGVFFLGAHTKAEQAGNFVFNSRAELER